MIADVVLWRIAGDHDAAVGWPVHLGSATTIVFALGTLYVSRAGRPLPHPVLWGSGALLVVLALDLVGQVVTGGGKAGAFHPTHAGVAVAVLTAAAASVSLYLLALRRLPTNGPLHLEQTDGRDPAVVFVHGLGASGRYWEAVVARLDDRRTVSVHLLGFGRSAKPRRASYDVDCHCAALARHVPDGSIVVAHSVGASVALRVAARHPSRVAGLVLIAPPAHPDAETARDQISELGTLARLVAHERPAAVAMCQVMCMLRPFAAAAAPLIRPDLPTHVAVDGVLHTWPSYSRTLQRVVIDHRIDDDLGALAIPLVVVAGTDDPVAPIDHIRSALDCAGAGPEVLRAIPDGGHHLILHEPGRVTEAIELVIEAGTHPSRH
ncbi:alpha/beta hydrolase [Iamia majanohamensis]|uniref:Alpha/beta hydrolase n=1 Tax=Iamia majanohamensis TaxID=467976 RepID=A0AAE9Y6V2_9ACTN|nr:alpha/beta hydrolase [Iamia majanohamensis]WCO68015.1 alpha/beta hydrolase [Iamia majanohamensis]